MADGSINFDTTVDTSGIDEGLAGVSASIEKAGVGLAEAFDFGKNDNLGESFDSYQKAMDELVAYAGKSGAEIAKQLNKTNPEKIHTAESVVTDYQANPQAMKDLINPPKVGDLKQPVEEATQATNQWSGAMHGVYNVLTSIWPSLYETKRAATGVQEVMTAIGTAAGASTSVAIAGTEGTTTAMTGLAAVEAFVDALNPFEQMAIAIMIVIALVAILTMGFALMLISVIAIGVAILKWMVNMVDQIVAQAKSSTALSHQARKISDEFGTIQQAIFAAFSPLMTFATPILMNIAHILITIFNTIARITASLLGQKTAMQAVEGSANSLATGAEGALAAFDAINVLQSQPVQNPGATNFGTAPAETIAQAWADIKKWWDDTAWPWLLKEFTKLWDWFANTPLGKIVIGIWDEIVKVWGVVASWFQVHVLTPLETTFRSEWNTIKALVADVWLVISIMWNAVASWFQTTVLDPVEKAFGTSWGFISKMVLGVWDGIASGVIGFVNKVIDAINGMTAGIQKGLNWVIDAMNRVGKSIPGWITIPDLTIGVIPHLGGPDLTLGGSQVWMASGGVIPPNSAFSAVLGDQTSGNNIEAPEDLIRQIVREESGSQGVTVNFTGTMGALVRAMQPEIIKEKIRVGTNLVQGQGL